MVLNTFPVEQKGFSLFNNTMAYKETVWVVGEVLGIFAFEISQVQRSKMHIYKLQGHVWGVLCFA
jgi:hypothetical protein